MYLMEHVGGVSGIRNDDFFGGTIELRRCVRVDFAACGCDRILVRLSF